LKVDRRTVLVGGGAGVGLIVAFALWPRGMAGGLPTHRGEAAFGQFIKFGTNGQVTVAVPQAENGQGIWTGLAQIVADELGAAWDTIAVEPAPLTGDYANLVVGDGKSRITANSTSIRAFEEPLRHAAASARAMLVETAAARWNVDAAECQVAEGRVLNAGRSFSFGELAEDAASRGAPRNPPRQGAEGRLIGTPAPRLDGPAKTSGIWRFAGDVRLADMLFASARLAPPGGKLRDFDRQALRVTPGIHHIAARDGWIAVAADTWWAADQALKAANPQFSGPATAADMRGIFEEALASSGGETLFSRGDYDGAIDGSRPLAATYYAVPSQHLGLEPLTATARVNGDRVELWAASQAPEFLSGDDRAFYPMPPGEPAGRAMEADAAPIAIELARQLRRPVQVTLSQSASQNQDRPSPGAMARMTALPGTGGITAAWSMRVATADGLSSALARLRNESAHEALSLTGGEPPYAIPHAKIEAVRAKLPFTAGYMRGSPEREFTFFSESFIDELAHAAGMEPLAFRMSMLGTNGRLARCLQGAARLARWDGGGAGSTMGIAGCSAFGSHIGLVASASVGPDQRVKVDWLAATVDCGRVVNRGLVKQQIEAGLVWALGQANVPSPEWVAGMPRARPYGGIALLRLADAPRVMVEIISSSEAPGGVAGLGTTVLAPAVANAIYAGTGKRMRSLPFDPMAVS
jgi:isoquinoline 1-oxidoreductase beta subunit